MTKNIKPKGDSIFVDELVAWGLLKVEAEVYVYLLQKTGESGGSKIASGTSLHRQYVYIALEGLMNKSLVEAVTFGKRSKYKACPPSEIEKITRKKSVAASDLVHELNKISAIHNDQDFEVLQGTKQIRRFEMDYVYESVNGEEEYIIGGHSQGFSELMGEELKEYLDEKNKKQIKVHYLGARSEEDLYKKSIGYLPNQESRFLKDLPQGVTHTVIRKDTVLFFSFLTPPLVYVIKSKTVAENYRQFFMMLWHTAKHN